MRNQSGNEETMVLLVCHSFLLLYSGFHARHQNHVQKSSMSDFDVKI